MAHGGVRRTEHALHCSGVHASPRTNLNFLQRLARRLLPHSPLPTSPPTDTLFSSTLPRTCTASAPSSLKHAPHSLAQPWTQSRIVISCPFHPSGPKTHHLAHRWALAVDCGWLVAPRPGLKHGRHGCAQRCHFAKHWRDLTSSRFD